MKPLVVANWKANPATLVQARRLFDAVKDTGAVICPPFAYLSALKSNGAQDCFWSEGAFTGEVSAAMLKSLGVEYVILGHSERRKYFGETEEAISQKVRAALENDLKPILCFDNPSQIPQNGKNLIIAFEPVSAISRGGAFRPYPVEEAKKMRQSLADLPVVLYGGSVNSKNARDYVIEAGFEGLLVGQASLDSKEFIEIVKAIC
ncbi:MAG: triosephosphate isomerase [Candidatus Nealsonbacteria bacterium]|nr:triosephosphate isomerase [Candidatus Nealsonbacteria bacterium]